jgi:hypothetical protein
LAASAPSAPQFRRKGIVAKIMAVGDIANKPCKGLTDASLSRAARVDVVCHNL